GRNTPDRPRTVNHTFLWLRSARCTLLSKPSNSVGKWVILNLTQKQGIIKICANGKRRKRLFRNTKRNTGNGRKDTFRMLYYNYALVRENVINNEGSRWKGCNKMTEIKTERGKAERTRAVILLVITATLWSTSGLLIKLIDWNPLAITGVRSIFAALLMWGYTKRPKLNRSGWQWAAAFAYAGTVIFFVMANKMTTSANAILLQYTAPIYVVLFARLFLGEKTSGIDWVTIIVVL